MPELEVQLLGELRITHRSEPLGVVTAPRQQALLAWLLLHPGAPQARKRVAFALWPDSDEAQAQTNLRRELHHLRRTWPDIDAYLEVTPSTLRWRHDAPWAVDVADFEQAAGSEGAALERAAELYRGDLLPGLDDGWLEPYRQALHDRAVEVLDTLATHGERAGEWARALRHARHLLSLEPLRESTYAQLMRLHLDASDPASARQVQVRCVDVLRAELGVDPGSAVQALARRVQEASTLDVPPPAARGAAPLVGRRAEWTQLQQVWADAGAGRARALVIAGEAGIGKTRLAEALLALAHTQGARTARTRSYAAEGRLAYGPISDWLRSPAVQAPLGTLERPWLDELRRLVPELAPDGPAPAPLSEGWQRQRLFEALAKAFLLGDQPLLLLLDDLQWCDQDTLEFLHFLLRSGRRAPLLLLLTLRREEQDRSPAVRAFLRDLQGHGVLERAELGPLSFLETAELAASLLAAPLPGAAQAQLFSTTEGQPLFVVEAVRAGLSFTPGEGTLVVAPSARVQAVIAARLEQLSAGARSVAQLAATVGRAFDTSVLRQASDLDEEELVAALDELWQRAIIREQLQGTGAYDFTHDRLREGASAELSPARRRLLHRRVAQALELQHGADDGSVAAQLAAHHEQAGQPERAVPFALRAAERANSLSASQDAIFQASQALRMLARLPEGPQRDRAELDAHQIMAAALCALRGFTPPELESTLDRALHLAGTLGEGGAVIRSLWGLFALHVVRGNVRVARAMAERALGLAGDAGSDPGLLTDAHQALGGVDVTESRLEAATEHFAQARRLYLLHGHRRVLFGSDVGVFSLSWGAHSLWLQGRIDEAREYAAQAEEIATQLAHPFTQMQAAAYRCITEQLLGDLEAAQRSSELTVAGCERYHIAYYREWGAVVGGWVTAQRGDVPGGLARIQGGLDALRRQDALLRMPYYLSLLAETHLLAGQPDAARAALDGAQAVARQNGDVWYLPEVHRLHGLTDPAHAATHFRRALDSARAQGSRSLELRAAASLAGHLHGAGQDAEARALLAPVVATFPETLVTPDLVAARARLRTPG